MEPQSPDGKFPANVSSGARGRGESQPNIRNADHNQLSPDSAETSSSSTDNNPERSADGTDTNREISGNSSQSHGQDDRRRSKSNDQTPIRSPDEGESRLNFEFMDVRKSSASVTNQLPGDAPPPPPLFVELEVLKPVGNRGSSSHLLLQDNGATPLAWMVHARWVKYEQEFDQQSGRFNDAHASPLKFTQLLEMDRQLRDAIILLDFDTPNVNTVMKALVDRMWEQGRLYNRAGKDQVTQILLQRHGHVGSKFEAGAAGRQRWSSGGSHLGGSRRYRQAMASIPGIRESYVDLAESSHKDDATHPETSGTSTNQPGSRGGLSHAGGEIPTGSNGLRRLSTAFAFAGYMGGNLAGRLHDGTEGVSVMAATMEELTGPVIALVRLRQLVESTETEKIPIRFIFLALGPPNPTGGVDYTELGRAFAVMMVDEAFRSIAYNSVTRMDILDGFHNFLESSVVLPVSVDVTPESLSGMAQRIHSYGEELKRKQQGLQESDQPLKKDGSTDAMIVGPDGTLIPVSDATIATVDNVPSDIELAAAQAPVKPALTCRRCCSFLWPPFKQLMEDWAAFCQRFSSDFRDAFISENAVVVFTGILFVFFVFLSPAITFGALLNSAVSPKYTITLILVATGFFNIIFSIFAGQPIANMGQTGPVYIMEATIFTMAAGANVDFQVLRFWVSIYAAVFGFILVIFNVGVMGAHIRRSVEELLNAFIGFFFLLKSCITMFKIIPWYTYPTATFPAEMYNLTNASIYNSTYATTAQTIYINKMAVAGATLFLAFIMLEFCLYLNGIKKSRFLVRTMRNLLGSFSVPIGIVIITGMERVFFSNYNLPKLNIPQSNQINFSLWISPPPFSQLFNYTTASPGIVHGYGIVIGFCVVVLIAVEVAINGLMVAKADRKLKKPSGFALDYLLALVLFPLMSGFLGWPYMSGAVVRSAAHVMSMAKFDPKRAPGEPPKVIGAVEQRVSGIICGVLLVCSVFLGTLLSLIPMAALYGVFLVMGVMGLRDLQLVRRVIALTKRRKHWKDYVYLKGIPSAHIVVFTVIVSLAVALLVIFNLISEFTTITVTSLLYPIVIILYAVLREFALPKWSWLNQYLSKMDKKHKLVKIATKPLCTCLSRQHEPEDSDDRGGIIRAGPSSSLEMLAYRTQRGSALGAQINLGADVDDNGSQMGGKVDGKKL